MVELTNISNDLDRSEKLIVTVEELKYRRALRTAMDLLKEVTTRLPENINALTNDKDVHIPEVHEKEVKRAGIRESPRKKSQEKRTLNAAIVERDGSALKRKKCLNVDSIAKPIKCHDSSNGPSGKPDAIEHAGLKDAGDGKKLKNFNAEQDRSFCKKCIMPNAVSHSSITVEKRVSKPNPALCRSTNSKGARNRLKSPLFTEAEKCLVTVPYSDKDDVGKGKTSGQDGLSCEKKSESRAVSHSSTFPGDCKSGNGKDTKSGVRRRMSTENKGHNILSSDPLKDDTRKDKISKQPHEQTFEPRTVSNSSIATGQHSSGNVKGVRSKFKKSLTPESKECGILSSEDDLKKTKQRYSSQTLGPKKKGIVQAANMINQGGLMDDKQAKGKFNQLPLPDFSFSEEKDIFSSDLSVGCSSPESTTAQELWPKDDTEDDVQLPVLNFQKEPPSFEQADFVWCKFQRYPYWPSLVKSVRSKEKKATIIFVEECLSEPNSKKQSFLVAFRTLKHYDCTEKQELLDIARKDYGKSVDWCDALICDYRIRLGCGSFSGSFLVYCTEAISYPVRRECSNMKLNFPSVCSKISERPQHNPDTESQLNKKMLPDRSRASRDKANEKLVECIVKAQQVEPHLIDVLKGKKSSLWLKKFQSFNRGVDCLETYLEDEEQIELVVNYLYTLCDKMHSESKKLMNGDQAKFILEVMLPEAVIFAIASTNDISYDKAEETFLKGPLLSKRERKLFEKQILEKKAAKHQKNPCSKLGSS